MKINFCTFLLGLFVAASAHSATAHFSHSYVSGLNRICVYSYAGSDFAITLRATDICPLTFDIGG